MSDRKIGRPTDNPKDIVLKTRLDHDTSKKLEECSAEMEVSKAEVVRQGISKMHSDLKK